MKQKECSGKHPIVCTKFIIVALIHAFTLPKQPKIYDISNDKK